MISIRLPEQNHVLLAGRLTHDPDLRFTQKGLAVCHFDIAVNRRYKDAASGEWKDDATFVPITVWGPMAERCKEKIKKGSPVHIEGRLAGSEYTDKSGQKRRVMKVVARRVQFLAAASRPQTGETGQQSSESGAETVSAEQADAISQEDGLEEVPF